MLSSAPDRLAARLRCRLRGCHTGLTPLVSEATDTMKGEPVSSDLMPGRAKTILLTTYKRDGTAVPTPVSIAFDGDRAFFRSYDKAWKTKRLSNNPRADVAASTLRGKTLGPTVHAHATLLEGEQARIAARALARRHRVLQGILVPLAHRLLRYQTMHYELTFGSQEHSPNRGGVPEVTRPG